MTRAEQGGTKPKLRAEHLGPLCRFLVDHPRATLREVHDFVRTELGVSVKRHALRRCFARYSLGVLPDERLDARPLFVKGPPLPSTSYCATANRACRKSRITSSASTSTPSRASPANSRSKRATTPCATSTCPSRNGLSVSTAACARCSPSSSRPATASSQTSPPRLSSDSEHASKARRDVSCLPPLPPKTATTYCASPTRKNKSPWSAPAPSQLSGRWETHPRRRLAASRRARPLHGYRPHPRHSRAEPPPSRKRPLARPLGLRRRPHPRIRPRAALPSAPTSRTAPPHPVARRLRRRGALRLRQTQPAPQPPLPSRRAGAVRLDRRLQTADGRLVLAPVGTRVSPVEKSYA